ncbi:MAG: archease [Longimicrobiales bacterium]
MENSELPRGVRAVEHTADLAIEVEARSLPELFDRAAAGMFALIQGADPEDPEPASRDAAERVRAAAENEEVRDVSLTASDLPSTLVAWLRELLYFHEVDHLAYRRAAFERLTEDGTLHARVYAAAAPSSPVREIKGVTYHQLTASRRAGSWYARVVFDV